MKNFFRNIPWVNILIVVLVSALLIGGIVGITAAVKEDMKEIPNSAFKRGALDSNGLYVDSDTSIYTKDLIECQGLEIEPDFEVSGNYQVFYYNEGKSFIGASQLMDAQTDGVYTKGDTYPLAKYCRIVITPDVPEDDDGNVVEDWKIRFYEISSFADDYTIKVSKKQNIDYSKIDLLEGLTVYEGKCHSIHDDYLPGGYPDEEYFCTSEISVNDFEQIKFFVPSGKRVDIVFFDSDGKNLNESKMIYVEAIGSEEDVEEIIDIPSGTTFIAFNYLVEVGVEGCHVYFVE